MSSFSPSGVSLPLHQTAGTWSPAAAGVDVGVAANHRQARIKRLMRRASIKRPPSHAMQHQSCSQSFLHSSCRSTSIVTLSMKERKTPPPSSGLSSVPCNLSKLQEPKVIWSGWDRTAAATEHTWRDMTVCGEQIINHFQQRRRNYTLQTETRQTQTTKSQKKKKDENVFQKGSEIFALTVEDKWLLWIWDALLS